MSKNSTFILAFVLAFFLGGVMVFAFSGRSYEVAGYAIMGDWFALPVVAVIELVILGTVRITK